MPDIPPEPSNRQRSSKACETCRARRIRCVGNPPCTQCTEAGLGESCAVRVKARPRRALSAKVQFQQSPSESVDVKWTKTPSGSRRKPLDEIEGAVTLWCIERGVPFSQLIFRPETRLSSLQAPPLPPSPQLEVMEDALIGQFLAAPHPDLSVDLDRPRLLGIYARYRAVPGSLNEDQMALLHATFCLQRYAQTRTESGSREDITYFQLACAELSRWNRPSTFALSALFCLVLWTYGMGGSADSRNLQDQMAWQIRELGLHRRDTASLYSAEELIGPLFAAFHYSDILRSSLTDLDLCLPLHEIEVDSTPSAEKVPDCLRQASLFTNEYLRDFADPNVDTATEAYVTEAEARWMPYLRQVRHVKDPHTPPVKLAWATLRYIWLRVLLYAPQMAHPRLGPQANGILARAVSQILHTYAQLLALGQLNPSWPQLQRLVVCGQLIILVHEAGELHRAEAEHLFTLCLDALEAHVELWPICAELAKGLTKAAEDVFGLVLPPNAWPNRVGGDLLGKQAGGQDLVGFQSDDLGLGSLDTAPWGEFAFDFDPTMLFTMGYDSLPEVPL